MPRSRNSFRPDQYEHPFSAKRTLKSSASLAPLFNTTGASGHPGNRANPCRKALLQLLRGQGRKHPVEGVMGGNPAWQAKKTAQPFALCFAVVLDLVPTVGPAQYSRNGDQKNLFQQMLPRPLHTRVL